MTEPDSPYLQFPDDDELAREAKARAQARQARDEEELARQSLDLVERWDSLLTEVQREGAETAIEDVVSPQQSAADRSGRVRAVVNTVPDAIITFSEDGLIQTYNHGAAAMFGLQPEQALGQPFETLLPLAEQAEDYPLAGIDLRAVQGSGKLMAEARARHANGELFPVEISFGVVLVSDVHYGAVVIRDIAERKRFEAELQRLNQSLQGQVEETRAALRKLEQTQAQLVEAEKHASLGMLVAGVAHEINTPLGVAITAVSSAQEELQQLTEAMNSGNLKRSQLEQGTQLCADGVEMALTNLKRAADLVQSFKQVAVDRETQEQRELDVAEYLREVLAGLQPQLDAAQCQLQFGGDPQLLVHTTPGALSQVVSELVLNAVDHGYRSAGGTISLQLSADEQYWRLQVSDQGSGIAETDRERVFDPFFTTRRGSHHTGLGLHVAYNLVTRTLAGSIRLLDQGAAGCCFELQFPRAENAID